MDMADDVIKFMFYLIMQACYITGKKLMNIKMGTKQQELSCSPRKEKTQSRLNCCLAMILYVVLSAVVVFSVLAIPESQCMFCSH